MIISKKSLGITFIFSLLISLFLPNLTEVKIEQLLKTIYRGYRGERIILDSLGVPIVDYGELGIHRNPVIVGWQALMYYREYIQTADTRLKELFLNCADWFACEGQKAQGGLIWVYDFPYPRYALASGWRSAMAQGRAAEVLTIAFQLTGDSCYISLAGEAVRALAADTLRGGMNQGGWYEEYAGGDTESPRVLNGMMFTLLGIYRYYECTKDSIAGFLFERGLRELKKELHLYDTGCWSYYDILGKIASRAYHNIHIQLLTELVEITQEPVLRLYRDKFASYLRIPFCIRLIRRPTRVRLAVFATNFMITFPIVLLLSLAMSRIKRRGQDDI